MNKVIKEKAFKTFYEMVGPLLSQDNVVEVRIEEFGQLLLFKVTFDETESYTKEINTVMDNVDEDYLEREMFSLWEDIMGVE